MFQTKLFATHALAVMAVICPAYGALAQRTIGFEGIPHGTVINHPVASVSIKSLNPDTTLRAFDSTLRETTIPGLEGPNDDLIPTRFWSDGNTPHDTKAGTILHASYSPSGSIDTLISFGKRVKTVTFDLINIQSPDDVTITLIDESGRSADLTLDQLRDPDHPAYQPGLAFGVATHNRVGPFETEALGLMGVAHLRLRLPVDSAVDNVSLYDSMPSSMGTEFLVVDVGSFGTNQGFEATSGGGGGGVGGISVGIDGGGGIASATSGSGSGSDPQNANNSGNNNRNNNTPRTQNDPINLPPKINTPPGGNNPQTPVPSPTAVLGGVALLATLTLRRKRGNR